MPSLDLLAAAALASSLLSLRPADAGEYFAGKNIGLLIGAPPGGGYDIYAHPRHFARHIPGQPLIRSDVCHLTSVICYPASGL